MARKGRKCHTPEEIQNIVNEKTNGVYSYVPDERFPYETERSTILLQHNYNESFITRTLFYIKYQMNNKEKWLWDIH